MTQKNRKILVTSALIYGNGPVHLGHLVELIQTDIWVRFQRLYGHECYYICGEDAHGTPIMVNAERMGITPEQLIAKYGDEHRQVLSDFYISVDHYDSTHGETNRILSEEFFQKLLARGDIYKTTISQAYDPVKNMFLPDRYIKGTCPVCRAPNQYGDNCEVCGSTYSAETLLDAVSVLSGAKPIHKETEHYFFQLENYQDLLSKWIASGSLQAEIKNKLNEWLQGGLKSWDITRDAPYFGFKIPSETDKYFYVWLDAPIGYIAGFKNFTAYNKQINFAEYWLNDKTTELYHFIGKDIIYFHGLFWPAMLMSAGYRLPTAIYAHGFLTINGQKMSKSRGTFIEAKDYLQHLPAECLRYYYAAKLSDTIEDIDFNFDDFVARINADLVGKIVNIASRSAKFIDQYFSNQLAATLYDEVLFNNAVNKATEIATHYENRNTAKAVKEIIALADEINRFVDDKKPWVLIKDPANKIQVQQICTQALNLFRVLIIYLQPIMPILAEKTAKFLNTDKMNWHDLTTPLLAHTIHAFKPLLNRIDTKQVELIKQDLQARVTASQHE